MSRFDPDDPAVLVLDIAGVPAPKGSLVPIKLTKGARAGQTVLVEQNRQKLTPWLREVRNAGKRLRGDERLPFDGPVAVMLVFRLPAPRSPRKRAWQAWPITRSSGDIDKLVRGILDALTGSVLTDDSQVTDVLTTKRYHPQPGVEVRIRPLGR
jgi:Holliday junction resolvase RusA-like endonuclease